MRHSRNFKLTSIQRHIFTVTFHSVRRWNGRLHVHVMISGTSLWSHFVAVTCWGAKNYFINGADLRKQNCVKRGSWYIQKPINGLATDRHTWFCTHFILTRSVSKRCTVSCFRTGHSLSWTDGQTGCYAASQRGCIIRRTSTNLEWALIAISSKFVSLWRSRVQSEVYWDVRQTGRRRPDAGQGQSGPAASHSALIVERVSDGDVTVPADAAEVQQRRGREQNVIRVKHITRQRPEQPLTCDHLYQQHIELMQPFKRILQTGDTTIS